MWGQYEQYQGTGDDDEAAASPHGELANRVSRPQRIQLSRRAGWRMPENTVKVDRTNKTFGKEAERRALGRV
jgi:hypothetical protein